MKRKSSKKVFTATYKRAKYIGNVSSIKDTEGVYYFSLSQNHNVYRPDSPDGTKMEWWRISDSNLVKL